MKQAHIVSNGCPESLMDSARVKLFLKENDWSIVDDSTTADLIIFNSCALTDETAGNSINLVKELKRKAKPDSHVIVWGCLPKIDPELLKQVYDGPTFGESGLDKLNDIINATKTIDSITANEIHPRYHKHTIRRFLCKLPTHIRKLPLRPIDLYCRHQTKKVNIFRPKDPSVFYIKASTGCLGHCTYCAIRLSRGTVNSKSINTVINEFREGLSKGYKDFALMGTDLGSYGRDANHNLADLLKEMLKEEGEYRIGLRNLNPYLCNQMIDELEPIFATGKIWYAEIPAESGSNRILKLMGRRYTIETYKEVVHRLRKVCPTLKIRTQIMVGFPTETNDDFVQSINLMNDVNFDYVEVFRFSPRIGTAAEKIQGRVSNITMRFREYRIKSKLMFDGIIKSLRHPSGLQIEQLSGDRETLNITSRINA